MRRIFAGLMVVVMTCGTAFALELPETLGEWHSVSTSIVPLITEYNHESHGRVTYSTYKRESPSAVLEVILTEGTGTGSLYVPEKVNDAPGMMPSDAGYERLTVVGHDAIIEVVPNMPLVIAVNVSGDVVLTVEGRGVDAGGISGFAERIMGGLKIQ